MPAVVTSDSNLVTSDSIVVSSDGAYSGATVKGSGRLGLLSKSKQRTLLSRTVKRSIKKAG